MVTFRNSTSGVEGALSDCVAGFRARPNCVRVALERSTLLIKKPVHLFPSFPTFQNYSPRRIFSCCPSSRACVGGTDKRSSKLWAIC